MERYRNALPNRPDGCLLSGTVCARALTIGIAAGVVSSGLVGCLSARIAKPSVVIDAKPIDGAPDRRTRLEQLVKRHDEESVVYPTSVVLRQMGPGVATLGTQASEMGQTALDQRGAADGPSTRVRFARLLTAATFHDARQRIDFTRRTREYGRRDIGNVPEPMFEAVWVPVPLRPDVGGDIPRDPTCPADANATSVPRDPYFCLYVELAVQPSEPSNEPAPMILLVAGLFHSSSNLYVRETAGVLFSQGYSVALVDMRDHGGTFDGQPWLPTTLGTLEGHDLVNVARYVRSISGAADGRARVTRFGAIGFSAGGLFASRAFVYDRSQPSVLLTEGVLAVSPLIDLSATLERMSDTGPCFILSVDCINRHAMAYYFMDLLKLRMQSLGLPAGGKDVSAISAEDYVGERIRQYAPYRDLPDPRSTITPEALADALRRSMTTSSAKEPSLAILSSLDDPVVGQDGVRRLRDALGTSTPSVGIYTPKTGGHIALSIVSPRVTRAFVREFFAP